MKGDCQKPLKKLTIFFLLNPFPFNKQNYQKQKGPATSEQSLFRLQVYKNLFISNILSDQVWWCNLGSLLIAFQNILFEKNDFFLNKKKMDIWITRKIDWCIILKGVYAEEYSWRLVRLIHICY